MPKVLSFDLDGTITDTHALHVATWMEVLGPHGVEVDMSLYRNNLLGQSDEEAMRNLLPDLSDEETGEVLAAEARVYRGRGRGMSLVLVANALEEDARESLQALGLADAFYPMIFAEEAGAKRPDLAPYGFALERIGVSAGETLAFENPPEGVRSAAKAGVLVVWLVSTHARKELGEAGTELVVGNFAGPVVHDRLDR